MTSSNRYCTRLWSVYLSGLPFAVKWRYSAVEMDYLLIWTFRIRACSWHFLQCQTLKMCSVFFPLCFYFQAAQSLWNTVPYSLLWYPQKIWGANCFVWCHMESTAQKTMAHYINKGSKSLQNQVKVTVPSFRDCSTNECYSISCWAGSEQGDFALNTATRCSESRTVSRQLRFKRSLKLGGGFRITF